MGQKIIPISLRLFKNKNWDIHWNLTKSEYSKFLFLNLEIKKYFKTLFNYKYLKLIKLNIIKLSNNINIYIYIHQIPPYRKRRLNFNKLILKLNESLQHQYVKLFIKTIRVKDLHFLNLNLYSIFEFIKKKNYLNKETKIMIYIFSYALYTRNIFLISNYIKQMLMKKKYHQRQIRTIVRILGSFFKLFGNFLGFRLQFKGRINGARRKKKQTYQKGKVPLNSLNCNIKYHFTEFKTPSGICSIKFWVFLKKQNMAIQPLPIVSSVQKNENNMKPKKHVYNRETNFFYQTLKKSREKKEIFQRNNYYHRLKMRKFYYQDYRNTLLNILPEDFKGKYNHKYPKFLNRNKKKN
jgi:ribosomal protein S3